MRKKIFFAESDILIKILLLVKNGLSKKDIANELSISDQRLRIYTAKLADSDLIRYETELNRYIVTDSGHKYIKENEK
ncbi:MAG: hypothetical protein DA328_06225 [Nitrososphaeraceae archaeon]|nr:hypothetical protein [Nitrososphaeraceae archaeon]